MAHILDLLTSGLIKVVVNVSTLLVLRQNELDVIKKKFISI